MLKSSPNKIFNIKTHDKTKGSAHPKPHHSHPRGTQPTVPFLPMCPTELVFSPLHGLAVFPLKRDLTCFMQREIVGEIGRDFEGERYKFLATRRGQDLSQIYQKVNPPKPLSYLLLQRFPTYSSSLFFTHSLHIYQTTISLSPTLLHCIIFLLFEYCRLFSCSCFRSRLNIFCLRTKTPEEGQQEYGPEVREGKREQKQSGEEEKGRERLIQLDSNRYFPFGSVLVDYRNLNIREYFFLFMQLIVYILFLQLYPLLLT